MTGIPVEAGDASTPKHSHSGLAEIGGNAVALWDAGLIRQLRHLDTGSRAIKLPAMVGAAKVAVANDPLGQLSRPMTAAVCGCLGLSGLVQPKDDLFPQQLERLRGSLLQSAEGHHRVPKAPKDRMLGHQHGKTICIVWPDSV
jgi:hypothetical protein